MPQSPNRQRGRPPKSEGGEPRAAIIWRNSRAYGDFRPWARWGGGQEPLVAAGERFASADATTASILFGERLKALRDLRRRNPEGRSTTDQDRLATFVGYHLACKATVQGRHRPSPAYVDLLRTRLTHAARFFGERARVLLRAGPSALAVFAPEHSLPPQSVVLGIN
jgi:hypothetical protein